MRRIYALLVTLFALLLSAFPALAAEGDPLAKSVLLPGWFAFLMVVLAITLMLALFALGQRAKR